MDLIANLLPLFVVLSVLVIIAARSRNVHFVCPTCGTSFKVSGVAFAVAPHVLGRRYVTCPNCGYSGMMTPERDDE